MGGQLLVVEPTTEADLIDVRRWGELYPHVHPVTISSMRLPYADRAEVDLRKLVEYCLSPSHPVGKHKAVVFQSSLGLTAADAQGLRERILRAAIDEEAIVGHADEFGDRYQLDFEVATPSGRALVRSAWIIRSGEDFARLTTCFVLPK